MKQVEGGMMGDGRASLPNALEVEHSQVLGVIDDLIDALTGEDLLYCGKILLYVSSCSHKPLHLDEAGIRRALKEAVGKLCLRDNSCLPEIQGFLSIVARARVIKLHRQALKRGEF